jgi:hypothetical protein
MDLLTRLVKEAKSLRSGVFHEDATRNFQNHIREAMPIRIQNVANYLYSETDQEDFDWDRDFPNIAPPWPKFFMWFKAPPFIRSEGRTFPNPAAGSEMAYLFLAQQVDGDPKARWGVNCFYWISGPAMTLCQMVVFKASPHGAYVPFDDRIPSTRLSVMQSPILRWPDGHEIDPEAQRQGQENITSTLTPGLLAISFCHCKNVTLKTEKVADKVVAKRTRQHGWSPTEIHELQIAPMQKTLRDAAGTDLKRSLHICRGHFKDYRDGRGLFGKFRGMFWWDFRLKDTSHSHSYDVRPR